MERISMINGVHHISFSVSNLEGMLGFYRDLLGLPLIRGSTVEKTPESFQKVVGMKDAAYRHAWLRGGNVVIEFFHYTHVVGQPVRVSPACDAGIRHICFDVSDVHLEYERLNAAGVEFLSEPQYLAAVELWAVYGRDPEGNIFELQQILPNSPIVDRLPAIAT
jgi:glyoxylase I family protein